MIITNEEGKKGLNIKIRYPSEDYLIDSIERFFLAHGVPVMNNTLMKYAKAVKEHHPALQPIYEALHKESEYFQNCYYPWEEKEIEKMNRYIMLLWGAYICSQPSVPALPLAV